MLLFVIELDYILGNRKQNWIKEKIRNKVIQKIQKTENEVGDGKDIRDKK